jgi:hypothetical protein
MEFDNLVTIKETCCWINKGIRKKMKTYENKTCLLFAYRPATTIMHQLSWSNKYSHAHIVICRLEWRPPTAYRPLMVVAYYL